MQLTIILLRMRLVLVALLAASLAPASPAATVTPPRETASMSGPAEGMPVEPFRFTYELKTAGLAERVAQTGVLEVLLAPHLSAELHLGEREIYAPGQKLVRYMDEQGRITREEPILARTFSGVVASTGEPAQLTLAPEGIYGAVRFRGVEYSLQPLRWNEGLALQEVVHDFPGELPTLTRETPTPSAVTASSTTYNLYIQPVAEPSFRNWASDWSNRITNGYFYAQTMWAQETGIQQVLYSPVAAASDYLSRIECEGTYDLGLKNFESWVWQHGFGAVNSYGLWHGADGQPDIAGCANANCDGTPSGCLQAYGAGMPRLRASHSIQAKDLFSNDNYDATRSDHLGKAAAHELTHNAGEPDHPGDGNCIFGTYNLMKAGVAMGCRGTWRTSGTIGRVDTYAPSLLTG